MPCGRWESDLTLWKWGGGEGGSPKDERCRDEKVRGVCMVWRASGSGNWESGERVRGAQPAAQTSVDRVRVRLTVFIGGIVLCVGFGDETCK